MHRRGLLAVGIVAITFGRTAQRIAACAAGPMRPSFWMPASLPGYQVVSDEVRNADELAATFWDPAETRVRLDAWTWVEQAEREFADGGIVIDVSIHTFEMAAGALLAGNWFRERRSSDLGLEYAPAPRLQFPRSSEQVRLFAVTNADEYSLYLVHGTMVGRVTVNGPAGDPTLPAIASWTVQQILEQVPYKGGPASTLPQQ